MPQVVFWRETEKETENRETEKQTNTHTDRQTDRQKYGQIRIETEIVFGEDLKV